MDRLEGRAVAVKGMGYSAYPDHKTTRRCA